MIFPFFFWLRVKYYLLNKFFIYDKLEEYLIIQTPQPNYNGNSPNDSESCAPSIKYIEEADNPKSSTPHAYAL